MVRSSLSVASVLALLVGASACTTFNDLVATTNGSASGTNGAGKGEGTVAPSGKCVTGADCTSGVCGGDGTCTAPTITDGVKNGNETDVDCGGADAPKCEAGKTCKEATDCFWGFCTSGVCEGHLAGRKDGDQTDVDCGGTKSPACDWDKVCVLDRDCASGTCGPDLKCVTGPSCKSAVHGGNTCGTGEFDEAGKMHESCCRSLPVTGFTSGVPAGKTAYLDKYEITAGRMRAFLTAVAAANGGVPNVKGWLTANKPAWWKTGWEDALPQAYATGQHAYTVTNPTSNALYPGDDVFRATSTQAMNWFITSDNYAIDTGVVFALGGEPWYPEFFTKDSANPHYSEFHNFNCNNEEGSEGFGTYYFSPEDLKKSDPDSVSKAFTQNQMDEKSLNCTATALFAAFCAWDGGQLMTQEVFDYVGGGTWVDFTGGSPPAPPPRMAKALPAYPSITNCGQTSANSGDASLIIMSDTTQDCSSVYAFPDAGNASSHDASFKVAAPGRVEADTVAINAGDEPWHDLLGNLAEIALMSNGTFDGRGYGIGWGSSIHHRLQMSLPRFKEGTYGARCMRFK